MKKVLLFLAVTLVPALSSAQICERDSNLLVTGDLFSPAPWTPDSPFYNLKPVCVEDPYNQSVTINVPNWFTVNGVTGSISSVSIATTNAIQNLPIGLTYSCDPPNCVFNANTLGCILLYGTPTSANVPPDTFDLVITASVATSFGPYPVNYPSNQATPNDHYYMLLRANGECISGTSEPGSPFNALRNQPNPFVQQTRIEVESTESGSFQFEVFDLLGNRLHLQTVQLYEGENQFTFDAGTNMPPGTYLFTLGNSSGKAVRRMVKL